MIINSKNENINKKNIAAEFNIYFSEITNKISKHTSKSKAHSFEDPGNDIYMLLQLLNILNIYKSQTLLLMAILPTKSLKCLQNVC